MMLKISQLKFQLLFAEGASQNLCKRMQKFCFISLSWIWDWEVGLETTKTSNKRFFIRPKLGLVAAKSKKNQQTD